MNDEGPFWFEVHDDEAVEHAIAALTPADLDRLLTPAESWVRTMGLDAIGRDHEDLLSESLTRTLDGAQSWKIGSGLPLPPDPDHAQHRQQLAQKRRATSGGGSGALRRPGAASSCGIGRSWQCLGLDEVFSTRIRSEEERMSWRCLE